MYGTVQVSRILPRLLPGCMIFRLIGLPATAQDPSSEVRAVDGEQRGTWNGFRRFDFELEGRVV